MTRLLAGVFDPSGRADGSRLAGALAPHAAMLIHRGPLRLAFSGEPPGPGEPLCLLDGFLDNATELAVALGGVPETVGPEQLLAAGYRRWGPGLLPRLRGDFVLLIWDSRQGEGLLARDQLGVRSLYLSDAGGPVSFASEVHQLLELLPSRPGPDPVSVAHLLSLSGRPGPDTLYTGIRRVNPGAVLLLDRHGAREESYWSPRFEEPLDDGADQLAVGTRSALQRAVERRIDPHAQTAVLMSGGLDSAAVAALAGEHAPGRVCAYAGVFPEHPTVDESQLISRLRDVLGLGGMTAEVRAGGLVASAIESARAWQMPLLGWGDFWTLPLLRAAAAAGAGVTLGGDGGDELFGSRVYVLADRLRRGHPRRALELALELPGAGDRAPRRELARILRDWGLGGALPYGLHTALWRGSARMNLPRWLRPQAKRDLLASDDPYAWKRLDGPRWWAHAAHGLTRGIEEAGIFAHHRRRAALAGLEARHPLFDLDLLELALAQPPEATLDRYRNRPVLRASMTGMLPDEVRLRPAKAWFDALIVDCLSADSAAVCELISSPQAEIGAFLDLRSVRRALLDGGAEGHASSFGWMHQVWRLVTAECWLRAQGSAGAGALPGTLKPAPAQVTLGQASPTKDCDRYVFPP